MSAYEDGRAAGRFSQSSRRPGYVPTDLEGEDRESWLAGFSVGQREVREDLNWRRWD